MIFIFLFCFCCFSLKFDSDEPFKYSGFIKVNETYDTNLYYAFFPAKDGNEKAPLILWLQGGPGVSSIGDGAFNENGPFHVTDDLKLVSNPNSWNNHFSMLYIDQPAGSGFSYTSPGGYVFWVDDSSEQLYIALTKFFSMYPDYTDNDFYAAGESYGGKWVPGIAHAIQKHGMKINLKGIMIGDGLVDPINQVPAYSSMGHSFGLLDLNEKVYMDSLQDTCVKLIAEGNLQEAYNAWDVICNQYFKKVTGGINYYDIRKFGPYDWTNTVDFVNLESSRAMMHTGKHVFNRSSMIVYNNFEPDFVTSIVDYVIEALDISKIKVMLYQGQFDWICGTATAERYISMMKWSGQSAFNKLSKTMWTKDGVTVGYKKRYGNLRYAVVLDAGHLSPLDQPENVNQLITSFINDTF